MKNYLFFITILFSFNLFAEFDTKCSVLITKRLQSSDEAYKDALDKINQCNKYDILSITNDSGYMTRPAWILMHKLKQFKTNPRMDLSCAESISERLINIPSSSNLVNTK